MTINGRDQDVHKGAIEDEEPGTPSQRSLNGQLSHREKDPMIKDADSDFPEPGNNPEHSGEEKKQP